MERLNRTITNGEAEQDMIRGIISPLNVKRLHHESHQQLQPYQADFLAAYNFARRLKTLNCLTTYEYICKIRTSEPERSIIDPIHQIPGSNT